MTGKESYVVRKERCPECAKSGRDRSGDNLAVYSDGHQYCFSCGLHVSGSRFSKLARLAPQEIAQAIQDDWTMPEDTDTTIGVPGLLWLRSYGITNQEIFSNKILWSESKQFLIFPFYNNGNLIGWQARNFNKEKPYKWLTKGNVKDHLHILGSGNKLILVEDIVSAIKVSRHSASCCLFGSYINAQFFTRLRSSGYSNLIIWLDPDKQKESIKFSAMAKLLGFNCSVLLSDKDPKEHSDDDIQLFSDRV